MAATRAALGGPAVIRTLAPLPPNRYLQVRWDAVETDADTLQVTFFSEVIDDKLRAYKRTNANAVLLVSKSTRAVLSLAEQ